MSSRTLSEGAVGAASVSRAVGKVRLEFAKMHGIGNDFVVFDAVRQSLSLSSDDVRLIADRHFGVGCDQVLVIEPASCEEADFRFRIFNADGREVEQCGNGARCVARFLLDRGLVDQGEVRLETRRRIISATVEENGEVTVDMGMPNFQPSSAPFLADAPADLYSLDVDGEHVELSVLSLGNPHAVMRVPAVADAPVGRLGPAIGAHPRFPKGVNVGFMEIINQGQISLRVYERGAGETLACGSGACAAVVAGRRSYSLDERVSVRLPGGMLTVAWSGGNAPVFLTGPATHVFEGRIEL